MEHEVPEGFSPFPPRSGFVDQSGPYYYSGATPFLYRDGAPVLFGFMTDRRHTNPAGMVHGGALVTFADTIMGATVFHTLNHRPCATVTLNTEFVSAALPGRWIEGRVTLTRVTRSLAFIKCELRSGEHILMNASGVWKLFEDTGRERPGPSV